jgi:hypothetical protein
LQKSTAFALICYSLAPQLCACNPEKRAGFAYPTNATTLDPPLHVGALSVFVIYCKSENDFIYHRGGNSNSSAIINLLTDLCHGLLKGIGFIVAAV